MESTWDTRGIPRHHHGGGRSGTGVICTHVQREVMVGMRVRGTQGRMLICCKRCVLKNNRLEIHWRLFFYMWAEKQMIIFYCVLSSSVTRPVSLSFSSYVTCGIVFLFIYDLCHCVVVVVYPLP